MSKKTQQKWGLKYQGKQGLMKDFYPDSNKTTTNPETDKKTDTNTDTTSTLDNISGGGSIKNFNVTIQTMKSADKIEIHSTDGEG